MIKFNKIEEFDEVLENLGFIERKVYQFELLETKTSIEILSEILKSDIFFDTQDYFYPKGLKTRKNDLKTNHAFTDKIEINDFEKLTFHEFEAKIEEIKREPDWGNDLQIFEKLITKSKDWIISNDLQNEQLYFIYADSISKTKLIENNYYAYFMSIVIISISNSRIIKINHGED